MGNHHGHHSSSDEKSVAGSGANTPRGGSRKGMSSSSSGVDIAEKPASLMMPTDKLAKILVKKSQEEDGVAGITEKSFTQYLFPKYGELATRLFRHMHLQSKSKTAHLASSAFRLQCERFLGILDDSAILEVYVKMFCEVEEEGMMRPEDLRVLLMTCYQLSMDYHSEGPRMCFAIYRTLQAVVDSCFHSKSQLSAGYVARWLDENCHRLVLPMHRYCVHILSTSWRYMSAGNENSGAGLELATPVLEAPPMALPSPQSASLLPVSAAWLLAGSLPPLYSRPHSPASSGANLTSSMHAQFVSRLVCLLPSHWTLLYCSREHGLGANRFLHHVLAYRGPTLLLLQAGRRGEAPEAPLLCLAAPCEWRESHQYTGAAECALLQLQPKFSLLEKAPKMLYLNTCIRGYPKGLRAGSDPNKPLVTIDEGFENIEYRGISYPLDAMEVWGCGDQASRTTQLDIKKWQVNEAERQRQVKLSASDWMDHPDRYLLELAGRPQYNNSAS